MRHFLKFGGLGLSAILTLALFVRLFGTDAYGLFMAISALTLFEGGAVAWNHILGRSKMLQRNIALRCQWLCVALSVGSSGAEIAMSTDLWVPPFDLGFTTLLMIIIALTVNIVGVIAYEDSDEEKFRRSRELEMRASNFSKSVAAQERIIQRAYDLMDDKVNEKASEVAERLAEELRDDAIHEVLLSSPRGANTARKPVIDNTQGRLVEFRDPHKPGPPAQKTRDDKESPNA